MSNRAVLLAQLKLAKAQKIERTSKLACVLQIARDERTEKLAGILKEAAMARLAMGAGKGLIKSLTPAAKAVGGAAKQDFASLGRGVQQVMGRGVQAAGRGLAHAGAFGRGALGMQAPQGIRTAQNLVGASRRAARTGAVTPAELQAMKARAFRAAQRNAPVQQSHFAGRAAQPVVAGAAGAGGLWGGTEAYKALTGQNKAARAALLEKLAARIINADVGLDAIIAHIKAAKAKKAQAAA